MAHAHVHGDNDHSHPAPANYGRAFALAIVLNTAFVAVEFSYGFIAHSTALMADAGHNLSDVLALALAWAAAAVGKQQPSARYTYGLRSTSILAALANAMLLLVACGAIAWEAILRFSQPPVVAGLTVSAVAGVGIGINGVSAWLFMRGSKEDLNIRGAYLHMAADAAVSLGVVIAGLVMRYTGAYWVDPVASLAIVAVIMVGTWGLLKDSVRLALSAVPAHIDLAAIEGYLRQLPGVRETHDLHVWGLSTTESALTVHLVMPEGFPGDAFLDEVTEELEHRFAIHHATLQIEQGTTVHACSFGTATSH